jgi:hypothetical protein
MAGAAIDTKQFDGLDEFATVRQLEYLAALRDKGSYYAAAKECGVALNVVRTSMKLLLAKAAKNNVSAHQDVAVVPDGFGIKGTSTLVKDGKVALQWVKTTVDQDRQEQLLREFAQSLADGVKGLAPITPPPSHAHDDLLCVVPMGDPHFGMYAWAADAGADFDLNIAERLTCAAIDRLVASGPAAGTALLLNLGDHFHADNQRNQTNSGHQLDVDGRWAKVQKVGLLLNAHYTRKRDQREQREFEARMKALTP